MALNKVFTNNYVKTHSSKIFANHFDTLIWEFFKNHCGLVDPPSNLPKPITGKPKHTGLASLRRKKQDLKRAIKALRKAGCGEKSEPMLALKATWQRLLKAHNRLRRAVKAKQRTRAMKFGRRQFNKNRIKFAKNLFSGQRKCGVPTFSKETAEDYFGSMYHDEHRSDVYAPLENMVRPALPNHAFVVRPPTRYELRKGLKRKRNAAAPGLNGLSYVLYKKCPSILSALHRIFRQIYKSEDIPESWASAFVVLLQKSDDLSLPSEFRPIAITNTVGKVFFSIMADRTQKFLVKNEFIKIGTQKGFLFGVPGCVEHPFAFREALRTATREKRSIVCSWIDLANAYGSIRHNLIQFALNWYHVPPITQRIIFNYYEKLCAKITTKEWSTGFFAFDIGLFQGCVYSTILFDCVFNMLLDFLSPLAKEHAFVVSRSPVVDSSSKAYADDLAIQTSTVSGHNKLLCAMHGWLTWTRCMKAKPSKCVCVAYKQFDPRNKSTSDYKASWSTKYSAYDPHLKIGGEPMLYIYRDDSFKGSHFKFLGMWINPALDESETKEVFRNKFVTLMSLVDEAPITGFMKLWLYQYFVTAMLSWTLMIQNFNHNFVAKQITSPCGVYLKRWAGVFASIDTGCLYRPRARFGLGLTSLTTLYERLQVCKLHILKHSSDTVIRRLYSRVANREADFSKGLRARKAPTHLAEIAHKMTEHQLKFPAAAYGDRRGLGHGLFKNSTTNAEHRERTVANVQRLANEHIELPAHDSKMQGNWLKWQNCVFPFDLSWDNVILGTGDRIAAFVLNATHNSVMTPDLRKLCGLTATDDCKLCSGRATLNHVLSSCPVSLSEHRYTWRHDSVLATILQSVQPALVLHNKDPPTNPKFPNINKSFVKAGHSGSQPIPALVNHSLLGPASDWKLLADFTHSPYSFPAHICATKLRPDLLLYSNSLRRAILGELTCPAEENVEVRHTEKKAKYVELADEIMASSHAHPWKVVVLPFEVGARGFVAKSLQKFLRKVGLSKTANKQCCRHVSEVAARCSYAINLNSDKQHWTLRSPIFPNSLESPTLEIEPTLRHDPVGFGMPPVP